MATLSPTAQALQKLLWARQDEQREIDENRVKAEAAAAYAKSRRELEIRLMEVSGDAAGARSARLADERDATVEGLRPLLDLINAQEKLNEENEKAAALLSQRKGLESQLLDLIDAVGAKARSNAAAIQALDPSLRPLQAAYDDLAAANEAMAKAEQDAADARDKLTEAYEREKSQLTSLIDKWRSVAEGFKTFSQQLQLGAIAGNSPTEQYAKAKADFERVARLVGEKDEKALGELQDVSERFLDASEDAQTENIVYLRDLAAVKAATRAAEAYAKDQVDTAERQLAALDASVSGLLAVNSSVISVRDAIGGLAASMSSLAAATAARDAARDAALQTLQNTGAGKTKTPVAINDNDSADLKAAKAIYLSANGGIATDVWDRLVGASSSAWTATFSRVGYEGDPEALRAKWKFADGGAFTNGVVHRPTMFDAALMGEAGPEGILPLANGPNGLGVYAYGGQRAGADPGVGQALAAQGQQLDRIVQATERSAKILTQVSRDGDGLVIAA